MGRGKAIVRDELPTELNWSSGGIDLSFGDSLDRYGSWERPTTIVSDGGYGVLGFEGDTSDHLSLPDWYAPHIARWAEHATPKTTLWIRNSEIGWAALHPIRDRYCRRCGHAHNRPRGNGNSTGNVHTAKIRRFPVVTEVCVQYVLEARVD